VRVEGEHHPNKLSREVGSDTSTSSSSSSGSNQNTCINQKPVVAEGDRRGQGQVIADGPCTEQGDCAWGAMCWWLHALARLKLRRRHPHQRKTGAGGLLHLGAIEEFEIEARGHQAGSRRRLRADIPT